MEILYYRDPSGNFGDDLNAVLWKELLPPHVWNAEDVLLMGVGSILNEQKAPRSKTSGKRVFVLGSGAGYGPLPAGWEDFDILAVRGPLTAALLGRPKASVTDSAVLIAALPQIAGHAEKRDLVLFIPHHYSAACGNWRSVAEAAGVTYLDPRWSVSSVMKCFSRARLVVTEAMHGAIVADTLRVPWIPISIAPDALPFKWIDYANSVGLRYEPTRLPPSCGWEVLNHLNYSRQARKRGVVPSGRVSNIDNMASLISDFRVRYKTACIEKPRTPKKGIGKLVNSAARTTAKVLDPFFLENAAGHLRRALARNAYLSDDKMILNRVMQLLEAVHLFVQKVG
jgi:succinoglycan biosynthesis protein ExoV